VHRFQIWIYLLYFIVEKRNCSKEEFSFAMASIVNIAAYQFAQLRELKPLRERLIDKCRSLGLKGTILLSEEGINLFLAGSAEGIEAILSEIRGVRGLESLTAKYSESDHQPFSRMLVKIKKEIIAFGVGGLKYEEYGHQKLKPKELKQWFEEGRDFLLLDTRNDYEIKMGTFQGAIDLNIQHFRQFPVVSKDLPEDWKTKPIVTFCTGGIRCEKAGPFLESIGFEQIYQIDGGILKYFEECGGDYYEGDCFVFDERVGLDPSLHESDAGKCFACQSPLTPEEMADSRYIFGRSCPYCHVPDEEIRHETLKKRHEAIYAATHPLPGSAAYENYRPVKVGARHHGLTMIEFLAEILPHISRETWAERLAEGRFFNRDRQMVGAEHVVASGDRYYQRMEAAAEPDINPSIEILHEDEAIVVIHKPAPLPMHPCGRFNRNTLQHIMAQVYRPHCPRPAHRLDANTSGVLVLSRTRHFAGLVQPQFERGEVRKQYLARVLGHPPEDAFFSDAPISAESGEVGSRSIDFENGLPSRTEFEVVERSADGTALLRVRPLTGRTNQIRVHLWHLGWPILNDPVYLPGLEVGDHQTIENDDAPMCLFAHKITFRHPLTDEMVSFSANPPEWAKCNQNAIKAEMA
jgi:RluA family pseudouridine synthase